MARSKEDPNNPWLYNPTIAAAIVVAHIYLITTAIHIFQAISYRTRFCIILIFGGVFETGGYAIRAVSTRNKSSIGLYATQLTLVVLAPAFVAAFNYMLFGRLLRIYSTDAKALGVSARSVTRIFVGFDVISFLTQSAGAGILSGSKDDRKQSKLGQHIVMGGLVLQLIAFGFFTAVAVRFHLKIKKEQNVPSNLRGRATEWRPLLLCLYASCVLIMLRSAYRVVEFAQGFDGYLAFHEVYFYVLEAIPMTPPFVLFNVWHPGRVVKATIDAYEDDIVLEEGPNASNKGVTSSNEAL